MEAGGQLNGVPRFNAPLPAAMTDRTVARPQAYHQDLTPKPSLLRPHCLARDRLRLWLPWTTQQNSRAGLSAAELNRVLDVLTVAWMESTRSVYGSGLLTWHVFCDLAGVEESERCPASAPLVLSFIATCAGAYSGRTLESYVEGIHAWHTLHGAAWAMQKTELDAAITAATALAPPSSKREKREPVTVELMEKMRSCMDLKDPLDAAVWACLTTTFWTASRLGEFTVLRINGFKPAIHVKRSDVKEQVDLEGNRTTSFFLPRTKVAASGEYVCWARQRGSCDPEEALQNHLAVNNLPEDTALFAWIQPDGGHRPLTKGAFQKRVDAIQVQLGLKKMRCHGIRIGAVLHYLLHGLSFETVKALGRWAGDSFQLYLREHAVILAPYIQDTALEARFREIAMPPIRR